MTARLVYQLNCVLIDCNSSNKTSNVDIILQSGWFWATSIASFRETFSDSRSCWVVFIHVVRGCPGGLLQFSKGQAVKICFPSDSSVPKQGETPCLNSSRKMWLLCFPPHIIMLPFDYRQLTQKPLAVENQMVISCDTSEKSLRSYIIRYDTTMCGMTVWDGCMLWLWGLMTPD